MINHLQGLEVLGGAVMAYMWNADPDRARNQRWDAAREEAFAFQERLARGRFRRGLDVEKRFRRAMGLHR